MFELPGLRTNSDHEATRPALDATFAQDRDKRKSRIQQQSSDASVIDLTTSNGEFEDEGSPGKRQKTEEGGETQQNAREMQENTAPSQDIASEFTFKPRRSFESHECARLALTDDEGDGEEETAYRYDSG